MSYNYATQKPRIFTEEGQVMFTSIRDNVRNILKIAGAIRCQEATAGQAGDTWDMLACVDRLVELGEIREIEQPGYTAGQHRLFVNKTLLKE